MRPRFIITSIFILITVLAQGQWSENSLKVGRAYLGSATIGNKVYFAGGYPCDLNHTDIVEIYNAETGKWEDDMFLSSKRISTAGVKCGSKVLFGGGIENFYTGIYSTRVDIFDTITNDRKIKFLSIPRATSAASNDTIVLFAGGIFGGAYPNYYTTDLVDILHVESGNWTKANLSQARTGMSTTVVGDLAFFAGGYTGNDFEVTNRIDIYNFTTGEWSIDTLSVARAFSTATTVGNKAFFAGGSINNNTRSDVVDIYDPENESWSTAKLSSPKSFANPNSQSICGKAFFAGGGDLNFETLVWHNSSKVVDVYDDSTNVWSQTYMKYGRTTYGAGATEKQFIVAGGSTCMNSVEILRIGDCTNDVSFQSIYDKEVEIFPNPSSDFLQIKIPNGNIIDQIIIYDLNGQKVFEKFGHNEKINIEFLDKGIYMFYCSIGKESYTQKIIKY